MNLIIAIYEVMKMFFNMIVQLIAMFIDEMTIGTIILTAIITIIGLVVRRAKK